MNYTYKVETYSKYENRIFVIYTAADPTKEPLGSWVTVTDTMTPEQIKDAINYMAPVHKWAVVPNANVDTLMGKVTTGVKPTPVESPVIPPHVPTAEEIQQGIVDLTQRRLDLFAQTRNYDGILSATTYATSVVPKFAAEGQYAVTARDTTWARLYELLGEVQQGTRTMPTSFLQVEPLLPTLTWPA